MKNISRIVVTVLLLALAITSVFAVSTAAFAAETVDTEVLVMTASDCSDSYCESRFQFKIARPVKNGYVVTFLIKPHATADSTLSVVGASMENAGVTSDPAFINEAYGDNVSVIDVGDGWYCVRCEVAAYSDESGELVEKYKGSYFYLKLGSGCAVGDQVAICKLAITDAAGKTTEYDAATLKKHVQVLYDRPIFTEEVSTVAVPKAALDYQFEGGSTGGGDGQTAGSWAGVDAGEFWNPDPTPYTWKVNATLGGAANLPAVVLGATGGDKNITNVNDELIKALTSTTFVKPNNLIFSFSDGYGFSEITLAEHYNDNLIVNDMPYAGSSKTASLNVSTGRDNVTTDSAAGGTALSTGYKTIYGYENLDKDLNPIPCISEVLREKFNKIIGVVTIGWAYDATPADFGGAHAQRGDSGTIAQQMLSFAPDLFIGEAMTDYQSTFNSLKNNELKDQDIGWCTSWSKAETATNDKLFVNLSSSEGHEVYYSSTYADLKAVDNPTISMVTAFSLRWLQAKSEANNNVGFFMMFENGQTDAAGHANNHDDMIGEANATDEMVALCLKFACENPDTLVVFSDDHETGGLVLRDGWENDITKAKFTTSGHSRQNVPVFACGYEEFAKLFNYENMYNAQVGKLMAYTMGIEEFGAPEADYPLWGSIASILDGTFDDKQETTEGPAPVDENAKFLGTLLNVKFDPAKTTQKIVLSGLTVANHDMMTLAYSLPAGATNIAIYGGDGATMAKILEAACDGEKNFVKDVGHYYATFKAVEDFTQLVIEVTGTFKEGDAMVLDNLVIATAPVITFDDYDLSKVSADGKVTLTDVDGKVIKEQAATDNNGGNEGNEGNNGENEKPADTKNDIVLPIVVCAAVLVVIVAIVIIVLNVPSKKSETKTEASTEEKATEEEPKQ